MEKYLEKDAGGGKRANWAERERDGETGQIKGGTYGVTRHTSGK